MGSQREHKWLDDVRDKLETRASIGVGGGMDSLTGVVKRAPLIVQKMNLEWLYRCLKEPSRAYRQKDLFKFAKCVIKEKWSL